MVTGILMNVRTQGFQEEHCIEIALHLFVHVMLWLTSLFVKM